MSDAADGPRLSRASGMEGFIPLSGAPADDTDKQVQELPDIVNDDDYENHWMSNQPELKKQLDSFVEVNKLFSYPFYLWTARIRFTYFFFLNLALVFVIMLAFVFNVFFSVLLPEARKDHGWAYRAAFMLPFAPIVLIGGSWFCDELIDMMVDAASSNTMLVFRLKFATVIHVFRNWRRVPKEKLDIEADHIEPEMQHSTLVAADVATPLLMELLPLIGFISAAAQYRNVGDAVGGYFAWGLAVAAVYGLIYIITNILTTTSRRFATSYDFFEKTTPQRTSYWKIPPAVQRRPLNLGRYLRKAVYWRTRFFIHQPNILERAGAWYASKLSWRVRVLIDLLLFFGVSMLTAYNKISFGIGWFLLCIIMLMLGLKLREKLPHILGSAFVGFLVFFTIFGGLLFIFAISNLEPSSKLHVQPPREASDKILTSSNDLEKSYFVCTKAWLGLTIVDLAILSNLAYARDVYDFQKQMSEAFYNTSMSDWKLMVSATPENIIHYNEIYFKATNLTVVSVRGTSTALEIYQDAYIYAGISIIEVINNFAPITNIIPSPIIQAILRFIALPGLSAPPAYDPVIEHTRKLVKEGANVLVTGHSLGGAVAGLVGATLGIPAVTFSPPGLYYNSKRLGLSIEALRKHVVLVIPDNDVVPKVDKEMGASQFIQCNAAAPLCHSIDRTLCKLVEKCGDHRGRDWTSYCRHF